MNNNFLLFSFFLMKIFFLDSTELKIENKVESKIKSKGLFSSNIEKYNNFFHKNELHFINKIIFANPLFLYINASKTEELNKIFFSNSFNTISPLEKKLIDAHKEMNFILKDQEEKVALSGFSTMLLMLSFFLKNKFENKITIEKGLEIFSGYNLSVDSRMELFNKKMTIREIFKKTIRDISVQRETYFSIRPRYKLLLFLAVGFYFSFLQNYLVGKEIKKRVFDIENRYKQNFSKEISRVDNEIELLKKDNNYKDFIKDFSNIDKNMTFQDFSNYRFFDSLLGNSEFQKQFIKTRLNIDALNFLFTFIMPFLAINLIYPKRFIYFSTFKRNFFYNRVLRIFLFKFMARGYMRYLNFNKIVSPWKTLNRGFINTIAASLSFYPYSLINKSSIKMYAFLLKLSGILYCVSIFNEKDEDNTLNSLLAILYNVSSSLFLNEFERESYEKNFIEFNK